MKTPASLLLFLGLVSSATAGPTPRKAKCGGRPSSSQGASACTTTTTTSVSITVTAVTTITPEGVSTIFTEFDTTTEITTLEQSTELFTTTSTVFETSISTDTATSSATEWVTETTTVPPATTTVAAPSGFVPVQRQYGVEGGNALKARDTLSCTSTSTQVSTVTNIATATSTEEATTPTFTSTSTSTITTTSTVLDPPASSTTTVLITSQIQTSTTVTTTTTVTSTTTVTTVDPTAPTPSVYDVCQPNNFLSRLYNTDLTLLSTGLSGNTIRRLGDFESPKACCLLCAQISGCTLSWTDGSSCFISVSGNPEVCAPRSEPAKFTTNRGGTLVVSNGACGRWGFGG